MAQGGGGAGAGAGGAVAGAGAAGGGGGGGGSKILDILKNVGLPVGLGVLASGSPLAAMGVRTGLGAWDMFSKQRRQKKLSELMADYYGGEAGSKVETPANAGDPAFGGEAGSFKTGMTDPGFAGHLTAGTGDESSYGEFGRGKTLAESIDLPEPGMTAGAELSPNKISTLLAAKSAPKEKGAMSREEFFAKMAASGGMTPMQIESLKAREEDRATSDERYETGLATDQERYAESTRRYNEGKATSDERYDETIEFREREEARAASREERSEQSHGANMANMAEDNSRAARAAEMAEERFELTKAQWEAGQKLDAKEISTILNAVNSSIGDMELRLKFADDSEVEALTDQVSRFRAMSSTLQSKLEGELGSGEAATPRRRFNSATGTWEAVQ